MLLRQYQSKAVEMARAHLAQRPILRMDTGSGKTRVATTIMQLAAAKGRRSLFLCDRRELVFQTAAHFAECGIIMAGVEQTDSPYMIASAQTLARRTLPHADLLIVDECHRSMSPTQRRIVENYPTRIGLTATPMRCDQKGLGALYGKILEPVTTRELVEGGWLARYRYFAPSVPDLKGLRRVAGDYVGSEAAKRMRVVADGAVAAYHHYLPGKTMLVFCCTRDHSREMAAEFRKAGVLAVHADGDTPKRERARVLDDLRSGEIQVLCNVDLFGYGTDVPSLDAVMMLRPSQSLTVVRQQSGRALRPKPHPALILDLAGNVHRHGLPDDPVEWSLEDGLTSTRSPGVCTCLACYAILPPGTRPCPVCGDERIGPKIIVDRREAELAEIKVSPPKPPVPARMAELLAEAHRLGRRPRSATFAFQRERGWFPSGDFNGAVAKERGGCMLSECGFCRD